LDVTKEEKTHKNVERERQHEATRTTAQCHDPIGSGRQEPAEPFFAPLSFGTSALQERERGESRSGSSSSYMNE